MLQSLLPLPNLSTGQWCSARDKFVSNAEAICQQFDASRETGVAAIAAELPVKVANFARINRHFSSSAELYAILLDIDRLNQINKVHGFAIGTAILGELVLSIDEEEQTDSRILTASRCGDDTFFLVIYGERKHAIAIAQTVLAYIAALPEKVGWSNVTVTASAGIAAFMEYETAKRWFERAYFACETARRNGGNRVYIAPRPEVQTEVQTRQWS